MANGISLDTSDMSGFAPGMTEREVNQRIRDLMAAAAEPAPAAAPAETLVRGVDYDTESSSMRLSPKAQAVLGFNR